MASTARLRHIFTRVARIGVALSCIAFVAGMAAACDPCRRCVMPTGINTTTRVHDSVTVTVKVSRSLEPVHLLPGRASASVPDADTARAETDYAAAVAYLRGRSIVLEINNKDTAAALVRQIETLTERLREVSQTTESAIVKRELYVPGIVKALAWLGGAAVAAGLLYVVFAVARRKFLRFL